jgi:dolichyl-phosphate beta-glucosyltransferase
VDSIALATSPSTPLVTMASLETDCRLSVVIPAYNEAGRIVEPLRRIDAYLCASNIPSELLVVDDGSTDDTADVVRHLASELRTPVRVVVCASNRGKGHAVKVGVGQARGELVLMTDADLSTPIEELGKFLGHVGNGVQVAIGSRKMAGAVIEARQPWLREMMGRVFTFLTRRLLVSVSDVTCGFKLFTREAAADVFGRLTLDDWSFDAEALFLAHRAGFVIREVPVRWRDDPGTKVRRGRDAARSALGLARILVNAARGRYGPRNRARPSD